MTFISHLHKCVAAICFAAPSLSVSAQPQVALKAQDLKLGDIAWNIPALAKFEVQNTGNQPLQILDVRTDCGCTTVNWSKTSIAPGASATLTVSYDANTLGTFHKSIIVTTSASATSKAEYSVKWWTTIKTSPCASVTCASLPTT